MGKCLATSQSYSCTGGAEAEMKLGSVAPTPLAVLLQSAWAPPPGGRGVGNAYHKWSQTPRRDALSGKSPFSVPGTESKMVVDPDGEVNQHIQASWKLQGIYLVLHVISQSVEEVIPECFSFQPQDTASVWNSIE